MGTGSIGQQGVGILSADQVRKREELEAMKSQKDQNSAFNPNLTTEAGTQNLDKYGSTIKPMSEQGRFLTSIGQNMANKALSGSGLGGAVEGITGGIASSVSGAVAPSLGAGAGGILGAGAGLLPLFALYKLFKK